MKKMKDLSYHYGLKVRIYPNRQQKEIIKINSDVSRAIYNKLVAIDKELYQLKQVKLPIKEVIDRINELEKRKNAKNMANHYQYMQDKRIDSDMLANAIKNYKNAWNMFRKVHRTGIPKFHKKNYCENYQTSTHYSKKNDMNMYSASIRFLDDNHINLPKLGRIRVSGSHKRILNNKKDVRIGTVTINKDVCDRYFVSMQLASDTPFVQTKPKTDSQVGIDLNTENFLTVSNGERVENPKYYRIIKNKLAKQQRKLSRRQRRAKAENRNLRKAKNYQKQRRLIAKMHNKIRNQRNNFLNLVSIALINSHDLVVAENLRSSNMLKNHALAMSISDVGWRLFLEKMTYKSVMYGRRFVTVDPKNTTQKCHDCGFVMGTENTKKLTLKDRKWTCPNCGTFHIRDVNASLNVLDKGLEKLAEER